MNNPVRVPYDLLLISELDEQVSIPPCAHCAGWYVEIVRGQGDPDGDVLVREWHDPSCLHLQALLADDERDAS